MKSNFNKPLTAKAKMVCEAIANEANKPTGKAKEHFKRKPYYMDDLYKNDRTV